MSIEFSAERWDKIKKNYEAWWEGALERPLISIVLTGRGHAREQPSAPLLTRATCTDLSISAKDLIDRIDYELEDLVYLGDAFPFFNMNCFASQMVAAFSGASLTPTPRTVWLTPKEVVPIKELHFEYDGSNIWLERLKEIYAEGMRRWQGQVLMGMVPLGGVLDILSIFRPSEALYMDLYDYPEEVERLVWEIHELWFRYCDELISIIKPVTPGYCDWGQIYSSTPTYTPQCDFAYGIGQAMFDRFVKSELQAMCKRLGHTLYHMDGVGQISFIDSLLQIEELDAVQWMPGAGKPGQSEWPDLYRKVHDAGKRIQITQGLKCLDMVAEQIGTFASLHHPRVILPLTQEKEAREVLAKYGVE